MVGVLDHTAVTRAAHAVLLFLNKVTLYLCAYISKALSARLEQKHKRTKKFEIMTNTAVMSQKTLFSLLTRQQMQLLNIFNLEGVFQKVCIQGPQTASVS